MNDESGEGEKFPITPIQGTYLIGLANAIGTCIPILYANKIGRRTIFYLGFLSMAIILFICGLSTYNSWNATSFIMIIVFIFACQLTIGDFTLLYNAEVLVDAASGFALSSMMINCMIVALSFEYMINSPLKVYGTVWYYSGFCLIGFLFSVIMIRETRGLFDLEKKTLYSPKDELSASELQLTERQTTQEKEQE